MMHAMTHPEVDDIVIDGQLFNPTVQLTEEQRVRAVLGSKRKPVIPAPQRERTPPSSGSARALLTGVGFLAAVAVFGFYVLL